MPADSRTRLPSLMFTNLEILPSAKANKNSKDYIVPLNPLPDSKLDLPYKYEIAPHLITLSKSERFEIERNFPLTCPHDTWARMRWSNYSFPSAPTEIYTMSLTHAYFTDPVPGKLPPIIYKWSVKVTNAQMPPFYRPLSGVRWCATRAVCCAQAFCSSLSPLKARKRTTSVWLGTTLFVVSLKRISFPTACSVDAYHLPWWVF